MSILGLLEKVAVVVFVAVGLFVFARACLALRVTPEVAATFFLSPISWLVRFFIAVLPAAVGLLLVLSLVYVIFHQHATAIVASVCGVVLIVFGVLWHLTPLGAWALAHLPGAA